MTTPEQIEQAIVAGLPAFHGAKLDEGTLKLVIETAKQRIPPLIAEHEQQVRRETLEGIKRYVDIKYDNRDPSKYFVSDLKIDIDDHIDTKLKQLEQKEGKK